MFEEIEQAVNVLQLTRNKISDQMDISAVEALIEVFSIILGEESDDLNALDQNLVMSWTSNINKLNLEKMSSADKRQVLQLVLVGTLMEDRLQANYQITPDGIGMWVAYFVEQFKNTDSKELSLLDISIGSGNLSATIQQVVNSEIPIKVTGIDNDDTMLTLASGVNTILGLDWQLKLKDAVNFDFTEQYQIVVGDLPVGMYPKSVDSAYIVKAKDNNQLSYVHHLLIEKAVNVLKPGGTALLLVPENILETEQGSDLLRLLQSEEILLQAIMKFPHKLFKKGVVGKELIILQKHDGINRQAEPVLLAQIPEIGDELANKKFIEEVQNWKSEI